MRVVNNNCVRIVPYNMLMPHAEETKWLQISGLTSVLRRSQRSRCAVRALCLGDGVADDGDVDCRLAEQRCDGVLSWNLINAA